MSKKRQRVVEDTCTETSEQGLLSKIKNSKSNNKKTKNLIKTWDRYLKTHFSKGTQMTKKKNVGHHVTKEFQIETMRYHYIYLLKTAKIQNTDNTKYLGGCARGSLIQCCKECRNVYFERQIGVVEMPHKHENVTSDSRAHHMKKQSSWKVPTTHKHNCFPTPYT